MSAGSMTCHKLAIYLALTAVLALGGVAPQLLGASDTPTLPGGITSEHIADILFTGGLCPHSKVTVPAVAPESKP